MARSTGPDPVRLERAGREAERAEREAQRDAAIAHLEELRRQATAIHLQTFPQARPPRRSPRRSNSFPGRRSCTGSLNFSNCRPDHLGGAERTTH